MIPLIPQKSSLLMFPLYFVITYVMLLHFRVLEKNCVIKHDHEKRTAFDWKPQNWMCVVWSWNKQPLGVRAQVTIQHGGRTSVGAAA